MTREQQDALRSLVEYVLASEEKHYLEALLAQGIESGEQDPYALTTHPDFEHIFRAALVLEELIASRATTSQKENCHD